MALDRPLWGVEFKGRTAEPPIIIGAMWHSEYRSNAHYKGEPTRALLFCTREQAREWCRERKERSKDLGWKFTPIKVREVVQKCMSK